MNWKNKFEKTVGMNTAIMKAQQDNFLYSKMLADMEIKNKSLHECAYTAHNTLTDWLNISEEEWDKQCWHTKFEELKVKMEEILKGKDDSAGIIT